MATSGQPISVLVVLSSAHEPLFRRYFQPTLPPGLRLKLCELGTNKSDGAYMSREWQDAMCAKVRHALDFCRLSPEGEPFIVSDVDVQFFTPFNAGLFLQYVDAMGCDLVFQRERFREGDTEVNCGFYTGRNTPAVRQLLARVLENLERDTLRNEQNAVNRMMKELKFEFSTLDQRFYARTHGFPPPKDIWMHHASWTTTIPDKIKQLNCVQRIIRGGMLRLHIEAYLEMIERAPKGANRVGWFVDSTRRYLSRVPLVPTCLP
jgi:Nucleotide-diphospho-sugar transferase